MRRVRRSSGLEAVRRFRNRVVCKLIFGAVAGAFALAASELDAQTVRFVPQSSNGTPNFVSESPNVAVAPRFVAQNGASGKVVANRPVSATAATPANPNDAKWPVGMFAETKYDYKGIPRGTNARHTFSFVNNSSKPIRLAYVRSSCGCTRVYAPTNKVYQPGEKGEIIAEIDAVRYTGVRHATLTAVFDSPRRAEVSLDVRGLVVENVRLTPTVMKFTVDEADPKAVDASAKKPAANAQTATIVYPSFSETIVKAESSNPHIRIELGKPTRTNAGLQTPLTVSVADDAPAGYFNDVVYLWSNGANRGTPMTLNVSGVVRSRLNVSPQTLSFEAFDDAKVSKNVVVSGSAPFSVKSVESESPALECKLSEVGGAADAPQKARLLTVVFDPTKLAERTTTQVKIETTDGKVLTLDANLSAEGAEVRRANASTAPNAATEKAALQAPDSTKRR